MGSILFDIFSFVADPCRMALLYASLSFTYLKVSLGCIIISSPSFPETEIPWMHILPFTRVASAIIASLYAFTLNVVP